MTWVKIKLIHHYNMRYSGNCQTRMIESIGI